jgi:hypothetical protein
MRKTQMAGRRPTERIAVRAETTGTSLRLQGPAPRRAEEAAAPVKPGEVGPDGATMDYQMGFSSGSSI